MNQASTSNTRFVNMSMRSTTRPSHSEHGHAPITNERRFRSELNHVIDGARTFLVLVSPYIELDGLTLERVLAASKRGVHVFVACQLRENRSDRRMRCLRALPSATLVDCPHSHAKLYISDAGAVHGSKNLTLSATPSRELCGFVPGATRVWETMLAFARGVVDEGVHVPAPRLSEYVEHHYGTPKGHCISCGAAIKLNRWRPQCSRCYGVTQQGSFCHLTGRHARTTRARPLEYSVYRAIAPNR